MDAEKLFMSLILIILFFPFCTSLDTLTPDQSIKDGQSLISKENNFALGFFSPGNSSNRYLGIWYVKVTQHTVVWVANRNDPINDTSGVLSINQFGNLVLHDGYNHLVWSTNVSVQGTIISTVAQLQDSGNLVLVQDNINEKVLWQSFDNPTDTLLPKMKLGLNRKTGVDRFLTSWKSQDDPGSGDCLFKMNPSGSPQAFLYKDSTLYYRTSPWPWQPSPATSSGYKFNFVNNEDEVYYTYFLVDPSIIFRIVAHNSGLLQHLSWNDDDLQWKELYSAPNYRCDNYGQCGMNSKCHLDSPDDINTFECTCLPRYEPKSPRDWNLRDGSQGCVRKQSGMSMCGNGDGFVKVEHLKLPDTSNATWIDMSMSSTECEQACLSNCSCTAFISVNIDGKGTGCLVWNGKLKDILEYSNKWWVLNVRVDANELATYTRKSKGFLGKKRQLAIIILSVAVPLFLVPLIAFMWLMKKRKTKGSLEENELEGSSRHPDLSIFDLSCIVAATGNFSPTNKLGEGGFGSVFKGELPNGQHIAVKRLSKSSGQGKEEFKNEVMLITKLQHRNLVKIFGCCIQEEEQMLIYEYMPNKSLDSFIFEQILL